MNNLKPPFYENIEQITTENNNFRQVLYTDKYMQLVIQTLFPNEDVGFEKHPHTTQFLRCEYGNGIVTIGNINYEFSKDVAIVIPPNNYHNIKNISQYETLNFYTIYSTNLQKEHQPGEIQKIK